MADTTDAQQELEAQEVDITADDMAGLEDDAELDAMKAQLEDLQKEADQIKNLQENAQKESGMAPTDAADAVAKEEIDSRSVYVGNVDYACTPEELQAHFQDCGTVNRVTILTDRGGNPKGFAYVEFLEVDAIESACMLDNTELKGRMIKVQPKRTNVPGMKQQRGRGRGRGRGGFFMPMMPMPMFGYGYMPRGRGRGRGRGSYYSPY